VHTLPTESAPREHLPFYRQLYFQVVFAIIVGVLLGHFEPAYGEAMKPLAMPSSSSSR
jgi:aerobic C4-dicarboxylate transport protein